MLLLHELLCVICLSMPQVTAQEYPNILVTAGLNGRYPLDSFQETGYVAFLDGSVIASLVSDSCGC